MHKHQNELRIDKIYATHSFFTNTSCPNSQTHPYPTIILPSKTSSPSSSSFSDIYKRRRIGNSIDGGDGKVSDGDMDGGGGVSVCDLYGVVVRANGRGKDGDRECGDERGGAKTWEVLGGGV